MCLFGIITYNWPLVTGIYLLKLKMDKECLKLVEIVTKLQTCSVIRASWERPAWAAIFSLSELYPSVTRQPMKTDQWPKTWLFGVCLELFGCSCTASAIAIVPRMAFLSLLQMTIVHCTCTDWHTERKGCPNIVHLNSCIFMFKGKTNRILLCRHP